MTLLLFYSSTLTIPLISLGKSVSRRVSSYWICFWLMFIFSTKGSAISVNFSTSMMHPFLITEFSANIVDDEYGKKMHNVPLP